MTRIMRLLFLLSSIIVTQTNASESLSEIETALVSILQESTSLRGSLENAQLKLIREKLRSLNGQSSDINTSLRQLHGESPPSIHGFHSQWTSLSDDELSILSHDSSFLNQRQQHTLSAAYLSRRRTSVAIKALNVSMLRGKFKKRNLASWTTHGDVNDPLPGMIVNGEVVYNTPDSVEEGSNEFMLMGHQTTNAEDDQSPVENEEYLQDLYNRLRNAVQTTQRLDKQYAHYDTNSQFTYSNPPLSSPAVNDMVQNSALDSDRQRLLTGSYAVWQWYDRNNLASPGNMDFKKVSRVNYAFFQTDGDGYIFGTDRSV
jgi:hypothetical protein